MRENLSNTRERIFFYTRPCYLDAALEYISLVKDRYDLYVVIQISESEQRSNILNLEVNLDDFDGLVDFEAVESTWGLSYLAEYFEGCKVKFAVFQNGTFNAIKQSVKIMKLIRSIAPSYIHFDDFTGKQAFLAPYLLLNRAKLVLNIHDPIPHSGEFTLSRQFIRFGLYKLAKKLVFFSEFSASLGVKSRNQESYCVKLLPYSVFKHFLSDEPKTLGREYVSFVGRLSKYKGIDLFLSSIPLVTQKFPNQKFLIAGKPLFGYSMDKTTIQRLSGHLEVTEKHLTNVEMVNFIAKSKVIICPYLDATQSGVILTSYALDTPVIVTNIGGLSEYVAAPLTGLVTKSNTAEGLANEIIAFLQAESDNQSKPQTKFLDVFKRDRKNNLKVFDIIYKS
jgi:glycosyltransferase involved in cell wall biosynthesis